MFGDVINYSTVGFVRLNCSLYTSEFMFSQLHSVSLTITKRVIITDEYIVKSYNV